MEVATTTAPLHESCITDLHAPTFGADWQRRAFGVAVALSEFGHYPWDAFQQQLIVEIGRWEAEAVMGGDDWAYYGHWLAALEHVVVDAGLVSADEAESLPVGGTL